MGDGSVRGDSKVWFAYVKGWQLPLTEMGLIVGVLGRKQRI